MEVIKEALRAIVFSSIVLIIMANSIEKNGEAHVIAMYFIVFLIPIIVVSIINGFWLNLIKSLKIKISEKRMLSMIPTLILGLMIFFKNVSLPFFDGSIAGLGISGGIGIGLNNLLWNLNLKRELDIKIVDREDILDTNLK